MPNKLVWTPAQDTTIKRLRAGGATWDAIAAVIGISRFTIIERGRRIGACLPPPPFKPPPDEAARPPLPAGHPTSWRVLTDGTVLEGSAYPLPVFAV